MFAARWVADFFFCSLRTTLFPLIPFFFSFPVFVARSQPKGTDDYLPAGVMAVPRSQQVSEAVFEQEENLKNVSESS